MRALFENPEKASCLVIAEVAQSHDGSLGTAHSYIEAIAKAGAQAVKFQTHIAEAESTPEEPWRVRFSPQDNTRYDYWKRMEFTPGQWRDLKRHADDHGLVFLSSAFSLAAVELLERLDIEAWKVGAGEITNTPMLEAMAQTGKPVLLSSGMAGWPELDGAVAAVKRSGAPVAVFQCTSAYPCPPERLGLNVLSQIRERYGCPAGLSDHSGTIYAGLGAVMCGAKLLEVHVTFSRECFGPDVPASVTTGELAQLVEGVRFLEKALAHPADKDAAAEELKDLRRIFGKSLVTTRALPQGWKLTSGDLAFKKPGTGLPPSRFYDVLNRPLRRPLAANSILTEDDLELSTKA